MKGAYRERRILEHGQFEKMRKNFNLEKQWIKKDTNGATAMENNLAVPH